MPGGGTICVAGELAGSDALPPGGSAELAGMPSVQPLAPSPSAAEAAEAGSVGSATVPGVGRRRIVWLGDVQIGTRRVVLEAYEGATRADVARIAHTACLDHACSDAHQQSRLEAYILKGLGAQPAVP